MKCQIRLLTIFVILLNFSILEAKAIKSSDVIVWPLVLQKIESICNQGNYDSAFNVLTETYTQYKLSTQNFETYNMLTIYNAISFFNDDYREHKFFLGLKEEIANILPPLLQQEISEGVAIELIKFWYFTGNKEQAFDFGKKLEVHNIKFIHGKSFIHGFSLGAIMDFEIRNGNLFNAFRVLNYLFIYTEEVSFEMYIKMLFFIPYTILSRNIFVLE